MPAAVEQCRRAVCQPLWSNVARRYASRCGAMSPGGMSAAVEQCRQAVCQPLWSNVARPYASRCGAMSPGGMSATVEQCRRDRSDGTTSDRKDRRSESGLERRIALYKSRQRQEVSVLTLISVSVPPPCYRSST